MSFNYFVLEGTFFKKFLEIAHFISADVVRVMWSLDCAGEIETWRNEDRTLLHVLFISIKACHTQCLCEAERERDLAGPACCWSGYQRWRLDTSPSRQTWSAAAHDHEAHPGISENTHTHTHTDNNLQPCQCCCHLHRINTDGKFYFSHSKNVSF